MRIREAQKAEIHAAIVDTGLRLMKEKGFDAISVDEITAAVGIAKGTFYNYFKTKEDLALAVVAQAQNEMVEGLEALIAAHSSTRERLLAAFSQLVAMIQANPEPAWIWGMERLRRGPSDRYGVSGLSRVLIRILEVGQAEGDVRSDRPALHVSTAMEGILMAYMSAWRHTDRQFDLAGAMRLAIGDLLDGVLIRPES